jgi:Ca-activated chloride channel family protein
MNLFSEFSSQLFSQFSTLQYFHFMRPYWLILVIPTYFILKSFSARDDTLTMWRKLMSVEIIARLTVKGNSTNIFTPIRLTWWLMFLLCIVLAGPTWQQKSSPFTQDDSVLVIAIDVSETMLQSDIQPSRLLRAKQKIIELLEVRGDANTALIAFSGTAHVVMPVTNDGDMIKHFLDALEPKIMPTSGKITHNILPLVDELLLPTNVPGTVLLVTDGITTESTNRFSSIFETRSHQLIVWAIGDANRASNLEAGSNIIPLQLEKLATLASESNGRVININHTKQDVEQVSRYINNHLTIVDDESRPWHDAGYPLVFVISALFLFWFRKGWTLQW